MKKGGEGFDWKSLARRGEGTSRAKKKHTESDGTDRKPGRDLERQ